ncbi:MAG: flagellar protein FlaE, partial [Natronomonas sp.]
MSMNPSDYDLDELRKMADERDGKSTSDNGSSDDLGLGSMRGESSGSSSSDSFRAGLYR